MPQFSTTTNLQTIKKNVHLALILDGTQDVTGAEQISVCLRHVDDDLTISEDFVGLYAVESTTGQLHSKPDCISRQFFTISSWYPDHTHLFPKKQQVICMKLPYLFYQFRFVRI